MSGFDELESRLLTELLALRTSTQLLPGFDTVRLAGRLTLVVVLPCLNLALLFADSAGLGCNFE